MRGRHAPVNLEIAAEAGLEVTDGLDVAVDPGNVWPAVTEVDIADDEDSARRQDLLYFRELLLLAMTYVLEEPLRQHYVEALVAEFHRAFQQVGLDEAGRGLLDRDVDAVIRDI